MKRIIALLAALLCIGALFTTVLIFADGGEPSVPGETTVSITPAVMPRVEGKTDVFICFDFYVPKAAVDYLEKNAEALSTYAKIVEYNEGDEPPAAESEDSHSIELTRGAAAVLNGTEVYTYTVKSAKITPENADTRIAVRAFMDYTIGTKTHSVASDFVERKHVYTPYDVIYNAYGTKSYTEDTDPASLNRLLSSKLVLRIANGKVTDLLKSQNYQSPYAVEYFDGVLTVSMNGAVPEWLLRSIYVNGEKRYFEIHGGKVQLVV